MEFDIRYGGLSHNEELQIVQADVVVVAEGETLVEEPLCIDVGLPALLASGFEDLWPDRFADAAKEWRRMPFFVCGCGDPDCRAMPFGVRHEDGVVVWTELDQSPSGSERVLGEYRIPQAAYRRVLLGLGEAFLAFASPLDYRPLQPDTMPLVERLTRKLRDASCADPADSV
ncbi:hypothetical protein MO973_07225 [Paenibacillus sp. TRM 82003]|nr:hypothetical protein [Paenibacillus sp. TRM 82003]